MLLHRFVSLLVHLTQRSVALFDLTRCGPSMGMIRSGMRCIVPTSLRMVAWRSNISSGSCSKSKLERGAKRDERGMEEGWLRGARTREFSRKRKEGEATGDVWRQRQLEGGNERRFEKIDKRTRARLTDCVANAWANGYCVD